MKPFIASLYTARSQTKTRHNNYRHKGRRASVMLLPGKRYSWRKIYRETVITIVDHGVSFGEVYTAV